MDRFLDTITRATLICGLGLLFAFSGPIRPFPAQGESLPDPTRPDKAEEERGSAAGAKQQQAPSWELTSIIHSPRRKLAVINGEIRKVGEHVAGAKVLTIQPDTVILLYRGQRRVLQLLPRETGLSRTGNEQGVTRK